MAERYMGDTIGVIKALCRGNTNCLRIDKEYLREHITEIAVKQGCVLIPLLFASVIHEAVKTSKKKLMNANIRHWRKREMQILELMFTDYIVIIEFSESLQCSLNIFNEEFKLINMAINTTKLRLR